MDKQSRVFIAGHRGLVGSAIHRVMAARGFSQIITRTRDELDLLDQSATAAFFTREKPEVVVLAAARVGGILANATYPAEFIGENLLIQSNVIHSAWKSGVEQLLFLGSSCIYPKYAPQPIHETHLLSGLLESSNRPYAVAKIAGVEMCWAYNRQYGTRYLAVMPNNLYGPGDNYDLATSHVLPALIRKAHEAKCAGAADLEVWGTGTPRREFLYSDDLADACMFLLTRSPDVVADLFSEDHAPLINIGSGQEVSIRDLADQVRGVVGFTGELEWDSSKPDGTPRKWVDVERLHALGWSATTTLAEGLGLAYQDFLERYHKST
ncbi:MAG: GDP-L-fucose synthase [Arenicellales bacterium]|nr:GDP-L-fucose synthase [Arenicellales bacterium]